MRPATIMIAAVIALFGFSMSLQAAEFKTRESGLYKDGIKILDISELISEPSALPKSFGSETAMATDGSIAPIDMSANRRIFSDQISFTGALLRCRQLVGSDDSDSPAWIDPDELQTVRRDVALSSESLILKLEGYTDEFISRGYPSDKIAKHRAQIELIKESNSRLIEMIDVLSLAVKSGDQAATESALQQLRAFFYENAIQTGPAPVTSDARPIRMDVRTAPTAQWSSESTGEPYPSQRASAGYDPEDLEETIDVQFTDDIITQAATLNHSTYEILTFVKENFEFQPYLGSRKGAQQTLDHRRGNDYDLASLMIALLRVSGIPARYAVADQIEVTIDQTTNWLGIDDPVNAASILTTAGMEGVLVYSGMDPVAVWCKRVYVEAYVPYINYRGAVNDSTGFRWIPLDPAFKQYTIEQGINLPAEINYTAKGFVEDHYSMTGIETPIGMYRLMLLDSLDVYYPGSTYQDLVDTRKVILERDGILPVTLPYEVRSYGTHYSEIPSDMRYQIQFHVYGSGTDLTYSTTLPEIVQKQVTISYIGATPADQQIINDAGGIFNVPTPYLVDLKPILMIDGCVVATGTGSVIMGHQHYFDMLFSAPTGASNQMPFVSNVILAGNYIAVGIDTEDAFPASLGMDETACAEDESGGTLHQTALTYLNNVDVAGDELADMMHQVVMNDVSEAIVENAVSVGWGGSGPISFVWKGLIVDADRKIIGPFSKDGLDDDCDYMRIGGADGSYQENLVFESKFDQEAISTIKILQIASDSGIAICEIVTSIAADCPGISQDASVITAINNALAIGHHVIIPQRSFTYHNWEGTGYIDIDPVTCAAGYIIAGGQNGGATVDEWDISIPDLFCLQPIGPITVSPSATNDMYCGESEASLSFTVPTLIYWGKDEEGDCEFLKTESHTFPVKYSIKQIADRWGGGVYTFEIGSYTTECGCAFLTKEITIVKIEFPETDFVACKDEDKAMAVTVTPSGAPVTFESGDPAKATVTGSAPSITVHGVAGGTTTVKAKLNGADCYTKDIGVCEIQLTECPPAWLPEGRQYGTAAGGKGNSVTFTATLQGGVQAKIVFKLENVSSEPGVCINYGDESGDSPDLKFIQDGASNPAAIFETPNADGNEIKTKEKVSSATVTVTCYDWGAWGKIKACCLDDEGNECGCTELENIPVDDLPAAGNHIADSWQPSHAGKAATWDDDYYPENMERKGDGFTFYEEYRGTMNGTSAMFTTHDRHDPEHKDLFIYDQDGLHLSGHLDHQYGIITSILIHYLDGDPAKLMNDKGKKAGNHRNVTWKSEYSHTQKQYALHVLRATLGGRGSWGIAKGDPSDAAPIGPPNTCYEVRVDDTQMAQDFKDAVTEQGGDPDGAEQAAYTDVKNRAITATMSHEMGHGTDVVHHASANGGRQSPYGNNYSGDIECVLRYDYDLIDRLDATHPKMVGVRDLARSPDPPPPPGTPARFKFSNYTDKDLSDITPVKNKFCTSNNDCRKQIDIKDP
jgi:hypothetical protein